MSEVDIGNSSMALPGDVTEIPCATIKEMIERARSRRAPVVKSMDDPWLLKVGLYVPKTNEWFTVSLEGKVSDLHEHDMSTMEARNRLATSAASMDGWAEEAL